jgi:hypothetical protein
MASKQTEEPNKLYLEWVAALKANPEMPLDELRHMWERITGEPGGVDYKPTPGEFPPCGRRQRTVRSTACCSARMAAAMWPARPT